MSRYHTTSQAGTRARKARAAVTLPTQCARCGLMIQPGEPFDMGHAEDVAAGGATSELRPEHRTCNRRGGGRLGAAIVNARKKRPPTPRW